MWLNFSHVAPVVLAAVVPVVQGGAPVQVADPVVALVLQQMLRSPMHRSWMLRKSMDVC